jgi:hypothetical protein
MQRLGAKIARTCGLYASHASSDSEALLKVKKSKMEKGAIKDLVYGGMEELLNNSRYYYHSAVGRDYSHLTDAGKQAVTEFMDLMAWKIKQANEEDLERRAKEQVMNALKGKE